MKIELLYFKHSGKYYSSGSYETVHTEFWDIVKEIKELRQTGKLPGLVDGAKEFIIYTTMNDSVPHVFP